MEINSCLAKYLEAKWGKRYQVTYNINITIKLLIRQNILKRYNRNLIFKISWISFKNVSWLLILYLI